MVVCGAEELEELEEMVLSENAFGDLCREEDEKTKVARGVDDDDDDDDDEDTNNKIVDQYVAQFEQNPGSEFVRRVRPAIHASRPFVRENVSSENRNTVDASLSTAFED